MKAKYSALAVLLFASTLFAATQYTTSIVNVNIGDPADATFYFEQTPGQYVGSDALIVQCDRNRAEFITHLAVYNEQLVSQFFDVNCSSSVTHDPTTNQRIIHYQVTGTPFNVVLTPQSYLLTVNAASWQSTEMGCGRSGSDCFKDGVGTATVSH